jgi:hypothetical protein
LNNLPSDVEVPKLLLLFFFSLKNILRESNKITTMAVFLSISVYFEAHLWAEILIFTFCRIGNRSSDHRNVTS